MDNVELVRSAYEAYAKGRVGGVLAILGPGVSWRQAESFPYAPGGEPFTGSEAVVQTIYAKLATHWDDFRITPHRFTDAGDRVVVEGRYTGRYKETDRQLDAQFCHLWDMQDGKATAFQQYTDTAKFLQAMGLR